MLREFQNIHSALHPPQNHKFSKSTLCLFLQKNILKKQTDKIANNQQQLQQFFVSCDLEWGGAGQVACSSGTRERLRDVCHSAFVANPVSPSKLQGDVAEVARSLDPGLIEESVDSRTGAFHERKQTIRSQDESFTYPLSRYFLAPTPFLTYTRMMANTCIPG